jgi:PQQ-like domain
VNDDFITRLGHALREAADREERRAAPGRAALAARAQVPRVRLVPALAAIAVGAMLVVAVSVILTRPEPARPPEPKVVARLTPGGGLDQIVAGFGSAWIVQTTDDVLLRMDPATRRVTARFQLRAGLAVAAGDDAIWVGERVNDLLRIDPQTNRVAARIPMPNGLYPGGIPVPIGDSVWVVGRRRAVRVDARTNRVTKAVTLTQPGFPVPGGAVLGGDFWVVLRPGRAVRLDGRTGKQEVAFRAPFVGVPASCGGALLLVDPGQVAGVDPRTGRVLWRRPFDQFGPCTTMRGLIWAEAPGRNGDRVVALDPRTGRTVASIHVGEFSAMSLQRVGAELWLTTADGELAIVRP